MTTQDILSAAKAFWTENPHAVAIQCANAIGVSLETLKNACEVAPPEFSSVAHLCAHTSRPINLRQQDEVRARQEVIAKANAVRCEAYRKRNQLDHQVKNYAKDHPTYTIRQIATDLSASYTRVRDSFHRLGLVSPVTKHAGADPLVVEAKVYDYVEAHKDEALTVRGVASALQTPYNATLNAFHRLGYMAMSHNSDAGKLRTQREILAYVKDHPMAGASEVASALNRSTSTIDKTMRRLGIQSAPHHSGSKPAISDEQIQAYLAEHTDATLGDVMAEFKVGRNAVICAVTRNGLTLAKRRAQKTFVRNAFTRSNKTEAADRTEGDVVDELARVELQIERLNARAAQLRELKQKQEKGSLVKTLTAAVEQFSVDELRRLIESMNQTEAQESDND